MITDFIKESIFKGLEGFTRSIKEELASRAAFEARRIQRKAIKFLISAVFATLGLVFLSIASAYLFIDYLAFTKSLSFLIVGTVILLIGIIIKIIE